ARAKARADSGTAKVAERRPSTVVSAGSSRSSGGSDWRVIGACCTVPTAPRTCYRPPWRAFSATVVLVHRRRNANGRDRLDRVCGDLDGDVEQLPLALGHALQDVVGAALLRGRLAHADAH